MKGTSAALVILLSIAVCFGDTLALKSGKTIEGTYLGGDARIIRMAVRDRIETFRVDEISNLHFAKESGNYQPGAATTGNVIEIPSGTHLDVRMIDSVDSKVNAVGQTFRAQLNQPVLIEGRQILPRGDGVTVRLVEDKQAGKLTGRPSLILDLDAVDYKGRKYHVAAASVEESGKSRTGQTAKVVGGLSALGAIIGAVAGGGKGAAIGALSGAGAGTAVQVLTQGPRVYIPSETRLEFILRRPILLHPHHA
jgi:hypothetical protein